VRPLIGMFPDADHPDVLVGLGAVDDAAVYRLGGGRVAVVTLDFFPPVVDDAADFGAIAAANAMSDVWAMGADPVLALNIALFPADMPPEVGARILEGAALQAREAGAVIAGGHTMDNKDPVFGMAVVGIGEEAALMTKGGMKPGQQLVLTKPLGSGIITTANKRGLMPAEDLGPAVAAMRRLNGPAARAGRAHGVRSATDITGFGLAGHLLEMLEPSGVGARLRFDALPLLPDTLFWADEGTFAGGAFRNKGYYEPHVRFEDALDEGRQMVLFDPQTSGGLLMAVDADQLGGLLEALGGAGAHIGEVVEEPGIAVG
jgi:selenide,water dikinase